MWRIALLCLLTGCATVRPNPCGPVKPQRINDSTVIERHPCATVPPFKEPTP